MVSGWPVEVPVGAFLGGLKDDLRIEVQAAKPRNLSNCFKLARMAEEKHHRLHLARKQGSFERNIRGQSTRLEAFAAPVRVVAALHGNSTNRLVFKCLTPEQIKEKRRKGICFHCNQPWTPWHTWRRLHMYVVDEEEEPPDEQLETQKRQGWNPWEMDLWKSPYTPW
uniref:Uncharacterized protein n=1 Tax=Nymphaea colorata TaxID=210225 RepID=A0A5K0V588_9MAGN